MSNAKPGHTEGYIRIAPGVLRLTGNDALDFLNRMSTNDLSGLKHDTSAATVLTTERGRVLDFIHVVSLEESVLVVTSEGSNEDVRRWLEKFVIMEDLRFSDETNQFEAISVFGDVTFQAVRGVADELIRVKDERWAGNVSLLLLPKALAREALGLLSNDPTVREITREMHSVMTIEEGIPVRGSELSEEYNPLELNLKRFVSFTKGCYIGQEVVARLDTYQKVQRHLSRFGFDTGNSDLSLPGTLFSGAEEVGKTTRHAFSDAEQRTIAIGFLRTGYENATLTYLESHSGTRSPIHVMNSMTESV